MLNHLGASKGRSTQVQPASCRAGGEAGSVVWRGKQNIQHTPFFGQAGKLRHKQLNLGNP